MAEIDQNVNGTWYKTTIYKKINGSWISLGPAPINYTFTSSITASSFNGIPLNNYVNPANSDTFNITVNSGVTLSGKKGTNGSNGWYGSFDYNSTESGCDSTTNCHGAGCGYGHDGQNGGTGGYGIDFTGFSGKTINIINNGTIKGGDGGDGGHGGAGASAACADTTQGGCGGSGGSGGVWAYNTSGITFNISGHNPVSGNTGAHGANGEGHSNSGGCTCFIKGQKVLMADGTYKNIEDIKVGDKVRGGYGGINTVQYTQIVRRGDRIIWDADGLLTTDDHGILNGDRNGFVFISLDSSAKEYGTYEDAIGANGNHVKVRFDGLTCTKREQLHIGTKVASGDGTRIINKINATTIKDKNLYHILVDGDMTYCISNTFVSSQASDNKFNYTKGEKIE